MLGERRYVTDGGLETDLIFHRGVDLPEFAAFPLVEHAEGRELLAGYYDGYADIARRAGVGLLLESPTWRANPDWGARLGYDAAALDRVNRAAIALPPRASGGPRGLHEAVCWSGAAWARAATATWPATGSPRSSTPTTTGPSSRPSRPPAPTWPPRSPWSAPTRRSASSPRPATSGCPSGSRSPSRPTAALADGTPLRRGDRGGRRRGRPGLVPRQLRAPDPRRARARRRRLDIADRRLPAQRLADVHAELDEAEELDEGDPAELQVAVRHGVPRCRACGSSAAAAAPTHAMSQRSGASEKLGGCPKTGSCTSSTRSLS